LAPRYYSIASSRKAVPDEAHLLIASVRYEAHGRARNGVASVDVAARRKTGDRLPVFLKPNAHFRLPADPDRPMIMIGPGTGVAPFRAFMQAIQGPEFTRAVEEKFGIDLAGRPTMVTARGVSAARDGQIHTDSRTKLITVLIYMNNAWEAKTGRLRLLRGPDSLEDVIAEVPPDEGTLLIFKNEPNAWHGFHAFEGPRRVIQLNWVTDQGVVWREQTRHKISAFFKRLRGKGPGSTRM